MAGRAAARHRRAARQPRGRQRQLRGRLPRAAADGDGDRIFVVLGTSHYGEPDRFGLTRKAVRDAVRGRADRDGARRRAGGRRAARGDRSRTTATRSSTRSSSRWSSCSTSTGRASASCPCCAARSWAGRARARPPETSDAVARFIDTLGEHRGARRAAAVLRARRRLRARRPPLRRRRARPAPTRGRWPRSPNATTRASTAIAAGDAEGFWNLVVERGDDDLKWCGSSPLYTFLRAVPAGARPPPGLRAVEYRRSQRRQLRRASLSRRAPCVAK